MFTAVHHVIIMSDSEGPIYQLWVNRAHSLAFCFILFFFTQMCKLAKVMSKGTLASESLNFNKTGIHSAAERGLIPDCLKWTVHDCCKLQTCNALLQICACVCVFACPKWSSHYLFLTCNYFCPPFPVPGPVSCFIFQATDRKHFFHCWRAWHSTQDAGWLVSRALADKGLCAACSFLQLCSKGTTSEASEGLSLSYSRNQRMWIKTRMVTDSRRRSLSSFIWYNEQDNQSKVRNPLFLFSKDFCDVTSQGIAIIEHICDNDFKNGFLFLP